MKKKPTLSEMVDRAHDDIDGLNDDLLSATTEGKWDLAATRAYEIYEICAAMNERTGGRR